MLNFVLLQRLQMLAKQGSFTKAAEELYITRSALIQQLNAVEADCGFRIFERSFRGVRLTEAGRVFMQRLSQISHSYDRTISQCREISNRQCNRIVIASLPNFNTQFIPRICDAFRLKHPDVEIIFKDYFPETYFKSFHRGEFDICPEYMVNYKNDSRETAVLHLVTDRHCCCVPKRDELAGKDVLQLSDLRGRRLMMYREGVTECDDALRDMILREEPTIQIVDLDVYDSSLVTRCRLERTILLGYSLYMKPFEGLVSIPLECGIPIKIGLGYHKNCRPIVKSFIDTAKKIEYDETKV